MACVSQTTYKKITIPLDNVKGVPFSTPEGGLDYGVSCFEVDEQGNVYFLGGQKHTTLAAFKGSTQLFRKEITGEFGDNNLYLYKDKLYVLDRKYNVSTRSFVNSLYAFNRINGEIDKKQILQVKKISDCQFIDTSLIIETVSDKNGTPLTAHQQFTLSGKFVRNVGNIYNLPARVLKEYGQLLGKVGANYLFCNRDFDTKRFEFKLLTREGVIIREKALLAKQFGEAFYEDPDDNRKLRNNSVFILGRSGKNALITEIPLSDLLN